MSAAFALARALLFTLDAESAHRVTLTGLKLGLGRLGSLGGRQPPVEAPVTIGGVRFANAVGLAAGFDKDGAAIDPLLAAGFGFVEIGGVTPRPQPGNPRPRVFRLAEDRAVINRYGLNSRGVAHVAGNLARRKAAGVVGVNLAANRDSRDRIGDYAACLTELRGLADFATINVSSPNTEGLRALQRRAALTEIFDRLHAAQSSGRAMPLFLKLAPDLTVDEAADIAALAADIGIAALIIGNSAPARPPGLKSRHAQEQGGLSGAPLMPSSTDLLRRFHELCEASGARTPLIGCGGVMSGDDARAKREAGASAVQIYTGLIYRGPALIGECARALAGA